MLERPRWNTDITIVEQKDPYLTYLNDQWMPTAYGQNMM